MTGSERRGNTLRGGKREKMKQYLKAAVLGFLISVRDVTCAKKVFCKKIDFRQDLVTPIESSKKIDITCFVRLEKALIKKFISCIVI